MFDLRFPLMEEIGVEGGGGSISDDVALLEADEPTEPKVEEPEGGGEEEHPEPVEEVASGAPEEGKTQPETGAFHPFDRPTVKAISEKYPEFFKDFPSLRDMYFREAEFSKVFPTVEDAKDAERDAVQFRSMRDDLVSGKGQEFFKSLNDEKSLGRFAQNFFGNLVSTNKDLFWTAANPLLEDVARSMFTKGVREGNENLQNAARHLAEYFFGDLEVAEGKKSFVVREDPRETAERTAAEKYDNERYLTFRGGVSNDIRSKLSESILEGDKLEGLSEFLKGVIVDKISDSIGETLSKDQSHLRYMDGLWDRAKKNGRTEEDKARLTSAYLARAKSLIPSLRAKYLTEVNGKGPAASAEKLGKVAKVAARVSDSSGQGRSPVPSKQSYRPKDIDYSKTSDLDILNDDITYRR